MQNRHKVSVVLATAALMGGLLTASAHAQGSTLNGLVVGDSAVSGIHSFVHSHPQSFGGSYQDEKTHTVHVLTVPGTDATRDIAQLTSAERAQTPATLAASGVHAWKLVTEPVRYSLRTLNSVRDALTDASSHFALQAGKDLTVWYSDPLTDSVRIGLTKVTPDLRKAAEAEFGNKVTLFQEARHHSMDKLTKIDRAPNSQRVATGSKVGKAARAAAATATRLLDSAPYAGGDRIVSQQVIKGSNYVVQCTVNFAFDMDDSTPSMGTAGHCGNTGVSWQQGYLDSSTKTIKYTGTMGKTYTRQWGNNKTDAELLNDTGNSHGFWTQVYIDSKTLNDVGSVVPVSVGDRSCSDGSFTGQNCSGTVSATDVCENVNDDGTIVKVCDLNIAKSGTKLVQAGDSGGPVYHENGTTLHPQGIISAGSTNGLELDFSDIGSVDIVLKGYPETTH